MPDQKVEKKAQYVLLTSLQFPILSNNSSLSKKIETSASIDFHWNMLKPTRVIANPDLEFRIQTRTRKWNTQHDKTNIEQRDHFPVISRDCNCRLFHEKC